MNRKQSRVTVSGYVEANKVLKKVKSTGKNAEFWPYIPQHLVYYPYIAGAYDKRAPAGYVRNVVQTFPAPSSNVAAEENIATLFSDENVNACHIMWGFSICVCDLLYGSGFVLLWLNSPFFHVIEDLWVLFLRVSW